MRTLLPKDQEVFTSKQLSRILGKSASFFAWKRYDGSGPRFQKLGNGKNASVIYQRSDVMDWLRKNQHMSTGEYES